MMGDQIKAIVPYNNKVPAGNAKKVRRGYTAADNFGAKGGNPQRHASGAGSFCGGPILEGEHPFPFSIAVASPEQARRAVNTLVAEKAAFLRVYNTLSREAYLAIASQAKDIRNTEKIRAVILPGEFLDRIKLDGFLAGQTRVSAVAVHN